MLHAVGMVGLRLVIVIGARCRRRQMGVLQPRNGVVLIESVLTSAAAGNRPAQDRPQAKLAGYCVD
jgi:hypothetical protein